MSLTQKDAALTPMFNRESKKSFVTPVA